MRIAINMMLYCSLLFSQTLPRSTGVQLDDCTTFFRNDSLVLANSEIKRIFQWRDGRLSTLALVDQRRDIVHDCMPVAADDFWPGTENSASSGQIDMRTIAATTVHPAHILVSVIAEYASFQVKRQFRLYPQCPAIACDFFLKGSLQAAWLDTNASADAIESVEFISKFTQIPRIPVLDRLSLHGPHWRITAVQFFDRTDVNNNLIQERQLIPFTKWQPLSANLLFAHRADTDQSIFLLKEAPCSDVQPSYPGADFMVRNGQVLCVGPGATPQDLSSEEWTPAYGIVIGVAGGDRLSQLLALRQYQEQIRRRIPGRDFMIMMNTWGDRNRDARLGEAFALQELAAGHQIGISHLQLDDGWQSGISKNSAFGAGTWQDNWTRRDYWRVNPQKFPNGLTPVQEKAKQLQIELCLWFNPSSQDHYRNWQADADAMIDLYNQYGIRTFKLDGVFAPSKRAEKNFRRMLDRVMAATDEQAVFNLDVTAGRRFGYHFFTEYGNLFLENRYTDWGNYYPHWTLRNLWQLSQYMPPQALQIEFLNKWRNQNKYAKDDVLAPARMPFDYLFAVTMAGQPLAWFEASGLPPEAMSIAPLIKIFRDHQSDWHNCRILPIGDEPSGHSWTGFQAMALHHGYLLLFREAHKESRMSVKTWLKPGQKIHCTSLWGKSHDITTTTDDTGRIVFELPEPFSFAWCRYTVE